MAVETTAPGMEAVLRANAIGLREVLFQPVAGTAPAAVTASVPG